MTDTIVFTKPAILDRLERLNNSKNGNPRYRAVFNGIDLDGKTKSDAGFNYEITSSWQGKPVQVSYYFTPKGKAVIKDMQLLNR